MSAATVTPPPRAAAAAPQPASNPPATVGPPLYLDRLYRFTVEQYRAMIGTILAEGPGCEMIEGLVVAKMPQDPPHGGSVKALNRILGRLLPDGWTLSVQSPITLSDGEPEPDVAVVRGDDRTFYSRHPEPADFGVVIEVADSSVASDRRDKGRTYARAGLPVYWIVNIPDRRVEVYTDPKPQADPPHYAARTDYSRGQDVPLVLAGVAVAGVPVAELLP